MKSQVRFPPSFSTEAIHLIRGLLKKDPNERLGTKNDVEEIKEQAFFVRRVRFYHIPLIFFLFLC